MSANCAVKSWGHLDKFRYRIWTHGARRTSSVRAVRQSRRRAEGVEKSGRDRPADLEDGQPDKKCKTGVMFAGRTDGAEGGIDGLDLHNACVFLRSEGGRAELARGLLALI